MAKIIREDCDLFGAESSGTDIIGDIQYERGIIRVPHYIGWLIIKMVNSAGKTGGTVCKVSVIKFLREWYRDTTQKHLGLKDAKDIADYYFDLGQKMHYDRPAPYNS